MENLKESSEVIFFLGAGASVGAGVPDTITFVKEFLQTTYNKDGSSPKRVGKI